MLRALHRETLHRQFAFQHFYFVRHHISPLRHEIRQHRRFASVPAVLLPPLVFGGLVIALWSWKCFMMVLFQNRIIYMPGLPPNSRRETIEDYKSQCGGIQWQEEKTKAEDGTRISLCVASVDSGAVAQTSRRVYILYFQGNASSLPPRLPFLSPVLRILRDTPSDFPVRYTIVCCSYRGYWTSKGRPSEKGIALDAAAALRWIQQEDERQVSPLPNKSKKIDLIIWGQSIGAGITTNLAAQQALFSTDIVLRTLILETPFLSIKAMLETLYPQKWLPYRYLWPFLRNHLDSWKALGVMQERAESLRLRLPRVLILEAGKDELVPSSHADMLEKRCDDLGLEAEKQVIHGALHTEVMVRSEGRRAVLAAIRKSAQVVI